MKRRGSSGTDLRRIALALPGAIETITWGEPHFRVQNRIFGGLGRRDGREVTSVKLEKPHAEALLLDPRFRPAPYVGRYGWIEFALEDVTVAELERFVAESHRLVAREKPAAKLEPAAKSKPEAKSKPAAKRKPAAKAQAAAKAKPRANSRSRAKAPRRATAR